MKLSLDSVGYGGYFTAPGEYLSLEEAFKRASKFGFDAVCIYAHRPLGFPMDLDKDRRKRLVELAQSLDLELGTVVCCTNYQESNLSNHLNQFHLNLSLLCFYENMNHP